MPKIMIICYAVPEIRRVTDVIVIFHFGIFFAFYPPNSPKNQNFKKWNKTPGDTIILNKCTKDHDHMLYCSWDMARDKCNCYFSFWAFFCSARKIKIKKKIKKTKHLEISSFYIVYHKLWSGEVRFLRYGKRWTDGRKKWHIEVGAPPKN